VKSKILNVLLAIVAVGIIIVSMIRLISGGMLLMSLFPDEPVIRHGEFPFCLTYEINGTIHEINDTLICDYDGFAADAATGIFRSWTSCLASGETRITLFQDDEIEIFYSPNVNYRKAGAFYMGDHEICDSLHITFPEALYTNNFDRERLSAYYISVDELWEKDGIKLLSWEIAPPIENTFQ